MSGYFERDKNEQIMVLADLMDQIPSELEQCCEADYTSVYARAKAILSDRYSPAVPYIGGEKNPHTQQLYFAAAFAAIHDTLKEHKVSIDEIGKLCLLAEERYFARFDKNAHARLKKRLTTWLGTQKLKNDLAESTRFISKSNDAWVYKHTGKSKRAKHAITVINCGAANFCKRHGLTDLLPYVCEADFRHIQQTGLKSTRAHCMGCGDEECTFYIDEYPTSN